VFKLLLNAFRWGFISAFAGYIFYLLITVFLFRIPAQSGGTAGCISLALGIIVFIFIFIKENNKRKQNLLDKA
jgi:hypothetical protein